jgi:hypothetical protein
LLQAAAALAEFAKTRSDDDGCAGSAVAARADQRWNGLVRRDHGSIRRLRQAGAVRVDRTSVDRVICGLTSISSPVTPARRRLRSTTAPTEPARGVAPVSATDRGLKSLSTLRTDTALPSNVVARLDDADHEAQRSDHAP